MGLDGVHQTIKELPERTSENWRKCGGEDSLFEVDKVTVDGEVVHVHPLHGPRIRQMDGTMGPNDVLHIDAAPALSTNRAASGCRWHASKTWYQMTSTEKKVALHIAASKNRQLRELRESRARSGVDPERYVLKALEGSL
mmetsp:Transcript_38002/g.107368  ORF Transcript_38002/g.107368 Transcript_38002/m.107368 type:complete len:140 (-) Transcript_38002:63-482(-)